jgi:hypothetical protein
MLNSKIEQAQKLIESTLTAQSILAVSFGKDSMVMLDIVRRMGHNLPVVYWKRERHFPEKNRFANKATEALGLVVYDFPPVHTKLLRMKGKIEVVNYFAVSNTRTLAVPSGIVQPEEGKPSLCALSDMYLKPIGVCQFPWDTLYVGHKDSDVDPLQGAVPLDCDEVKPEGSPRLVFPLRHFTDSDIWEYSRRFEVLQDTDRYTADGEDVTFNNDYYPACTACLNPDNDAQVWCPKFNSQMPNISSEVQWVDSIRPAYWKEPNA